MRSHVFLPSGKKVSHLCKHYNGYFDKLITEDNLSESIKLYLMEKNSNYYIKIATITSRVPTFIIFKTEVNCIRIFPFI